MRIKIEEAKPTPDASRSTNPSMVIMRSSLEKLSSQQGCFQLPLVLLISLINSSRGLLEHVSENQFGAWISIWVRTFHKILS